MNNLDGVFWAIIKEVYIIVEIVVSTAIEKIEKATCLLYFFLCSLKDV
jgi:hypothetical protein